MRLFAAALLVLAACNPAPPVACATGVDITGAYTCTGECVAPAAGGQDTTFVENGVSYHLRTLTETDSILAVPGSEGLYRVRILVKEDHEAERREAEIGSLAGTTLYTATAIDSITTYLAEDYVFVPDAACRAESFTKAFRGVAEGEYLACTVRCLRAG